MSSSSTVMRAVLAMAMGGLAGLGVAARPQVEPPPPDPALLATARTALVGDLRTADLRRALFAVDRYLESAPQDHEARALKKSLIGQQRCRDAFEAGEHALAVDDPASASAAFRDVDPGCQLFPFARTRLEQIAAP